MTTGVSFWQNECFFTGVSIDGPEDCTINSESQTIIWAHKKTLKGYELLKKHNVQTELLTVVSAENVNFPLKVYGFLKQLGSNYLTFLPLAERNHGFDSGRPHPFRRTKCPVWSGSIATARNLIRGQPVVQGDPMFPAVGASENPAVGCSREEDVPRFEGRPPTH